jgi:glycosyltransferase involved in cell wall biosynthesis
MQNITICYFGIYDPDLARNKIFLSGLRLNGVKVIECCVHSRGLSKYLTLFNKHWKIRKDYDVMIVGYPGYKMVPWARIMTGKPLVFDAFFSLYEQMVISRKPELRKTWKSLFIDLLDRISVSMSDQVLVESDCQRDYFVKRFDMAPEKCQRIYTGADNEIFHPLAQDRKNAGFKVLFRGRLMPEAGIECILESAKILKNEKIDFIVIGFGILEERARSLIKEYDLTNVELVTDELPTDILAKRMQECDISLGQFADHERLERTIPHKAFESLAMKIPYITGDTPAAREFFKDGENCLMVDLADPDGLAASILKLKNDQALAKSISENGFEMFNRSFTPKVLGSQILESIHKIKK